MNFPLSAVFGGAGLVGMEECNNGMRTSELKRWARNGVMVILWGLAVGVNGVEEVGPDLTSAVMRSFFSDYCIKCHSADRRKGDFNVEAHWDQTELYEDHEVWNRVIDVLAHEDMPPEDERQPDPKVRAEFLAFLRGQLEAIDCEENVNPGRVTIRRLNRTEYNHTIRDLVWVDFEPAADFPEDEVGYGFDRIGDVLSLSSIQLEKYLEAAQVIADRAILVDPPEWPPRQRWEAEAFESGERDSIRPEQGRYLGMFREGEAGRSVELEGGDYMLRLRAFGDQAGPDPPRLEVSIDGNEVEIFSVGALDQAPELYEKRITIRGGTHRLALAYLNNYNVQDHPNPRLNGDRNVFVDYVEFVGPLGGKPPALPEFHRWLIPEPPAPGDELEAARQALRRFVFRAYRRPPQDREVEKLTRLVAMVLEDGGGYAEAMQVALQAVLVSPQFLFRWELDPPEPATGRDGSTAIAGVRSLNDYELAARLSYFLWSTMPDGELFGLARSEELVRTDVLVEQVGRMLRDPKAEDFLVDFTGQWLQIRNLDQVTPDPELFPEFDAELRASMRRETEMYVAALVREDRSILELLDSDFTFLNGRLARHYGISDVEGEEFRRVDLPEDSRRGGVLTQASVLTITSNPTRTSPVVRGKWILEQILGTPPPPPPPDVPPLEENGDGIQVASLRQKLEQHRSKPECAGCHAKMDPLGFAFENFDVVGRWRELDGKFPIDSSGELPTGERFQGPTELKAILRHRESFVRSLARKMLTYALGRGLEFYDKCAVDHIVEHVVANQHRFSALIEGIVTSEPFRRRKLEGNDS